MTSDREKLGETNPRSWTSCGLCSGYNVAFGIGIPLLYGLSKPERHITASATLPVECGRPHSTGENPPYGMIGGVEEIALGKAREGGIRDESMKPFNGVQLVQVQPGQSLASRPEASVASRRVTGGAEAYTARKQAVRIQLRHRPSS